MGTPEGRYIYKRIILEDGGWGWTVGRFDADWGWHQEFNFRDREEAMWCAERLNRGRRVDVQLIEARARARRVARQYLILRGAVRGGFLALALAVAVGGLVNALVVAAARWGDEVAAVALVVCLGAVAGAAWVAADNTAGRRVG